MNAHPLSTLSPGSRAASSTRSCLAVLALLLIAAGQPTALQAGCGNNTPAFVLPQNLWYDGVFRPAETSLAGNQIPAIRDSSSYNSVGIPGFTSGWEIFQGLDVAGDFLYVAYNAGLSIWDIGANPDEPPRILVRDGWYDPACQASSNCGPFMSFPDDPGHTFLLIEDVSVLVKGADHYIALSGKSPVGTSIWRFNTTSRQITQIYQDTTRISRQVRLVEVGGGPFGPTIYALAASDANIVDGGLSIYDVSEANDNPCLQNDAADCPGIYVGNLGELRSVYNLDVMVRPSGETLISVADANVSNFNFELWEVPDLGNPSTATRLFSGLHPNTYGNALFNYEGNDYLAVLEQVGEIPNADNVIKIFNINACDGPCSLGAPEFQLAVPARLSFQFLTYSTSNGRPFLYYGLFGGFGGPKVEQLLDLTTLGRPGQNITEMTDGSPTYFDTCRNTNLDYWAWYYPGNEFGFANMSPRVGKFDSDTNYFYRAAGGMLDVHIWEGGVLSDPTTTTTLINPDPQGLYWMTDEITFQSTGGEGCNPAGIWTWTATTPPQVDAVTVNESGNQVTYRFECNTLDRCNDATVSVTGANSDPSCTDANETAASLEVKDPAVEITSLEPSSGTFSQCNNVVFTAGLVGRGPIDLSWATRRGPEQDPVQDPQQTLDDTIGDEDLSAATADFTWNTANASFAGIFYDGFESGDTSAWSQPASLIENFIIDVELGSGINRGGSSASSTVELTSIAGDPAFSFPPIESSTVDNATFNFHANTVPGTVSQWVWELEDINGVFSCTFGEDLNVPCFIKSGQDISHTWEGQTGDRRVDLTISNCQSATMDGASITVAVESAEPLVVTSFELDRAQSAESCDIDFDCLQTNVCVCFTGETIFFEVTSTGDPDFYDFDWDGNGSFEDTGNAATATTFTNVYPTPIGEVMPAVRARRGAETPVERDLLETLDIQEEGFEPLVVTGFELDRAESAEACNIDFDCLQTSVCVCYTGETITFEVTATGSPDFYDFDWNGNGTFEDTGNPATGTSFTNVYPTPIGQVVPIVRARRGSTTSTDRNLAETLDIQDEGGGDPLAITAFELERAQSAGACDIDAECINQNLCTCYVDETVVLEVTATGDPDFYDFDWNGNGTFEDTDNPATGNTFTHIYETPIGQIVPGVRARKAGESPVERDLLETLDIQEQGPPQLEVTSFSLDRDQSAGACEINGECLFDLICLCHINETVTVEVTATGGPDVYDFDWDGDGTFEDTDVPAVGTEYTHVYPEVLGQVMPAVRARTTGETSPPQDMLETLDIQP